MLTGHVSIGQSLWEVGKVRERTTAAHHTVGVGELLLAYCVFPNECQVPSSFS